MDLSGKNILIVRLGKIGDIIVISSVFEILKKRFPGIRISLLTLRKNQEVVKYNPNIDQIYFTSKNLFLYSSLFKLRRKRFDLLLDLNDDPSRSSIIIRNIVKAEISAGFDFDSKSKPDIAINQPLKNKTHIIERLEALLNGIDVYPEKNELKPVLYLDNHSNADVVNQLGITKVKNKILGINISAGASIREWNEKNYHELFKKLEKYAEWYFLILHSKHDVVKSERLKKIISSDRVITMNYHSFQHFASYIRNADLIITPDTSAVHICSAFNIPVIALYPNVEWNFVSWQPLSDIRISLRSNEESINGITVDEVLNSFIKVQSIVTNK